MLADNRNSVSAGQRGCPPHPAQTSTQVHSGSNSLNQVGGTRWRPTDAGDEDLTPTPRPRRRPRPFVAYAVIITAFTAYVLLDAFVIPRTYAQVSMGATTDAAGEELAVTSSVTSEEVSSATGSQSGTSGRRRSKGRSSGSGATSSREDTSSSTSSATSGSSRSAAVTDTTYDNAKMTATLTTTRYQDTTVYVVDVQTDDPKALLAAFANNVYGKNVTDTTSSMAAAADAIVAINGDYYGARNAGYVLRNGVLYRATPASAIQEDLVIWSDGSFELIREGDVTAQELVDRGAWQVFSFGPGLVADGVVSVDEDDEVGRAMASNPRTALAQLGNGHYALVVSDGRTDESEGLSLQELATFLVDELGAKTAYNLDGGGSSTLWFNGSVVNNPTTNGTHVSERSVSDIVYLAK